ncbi:pentapeptide repeat-containing protein [Flavitalea sp.]|nr:pentapeptide repeat-containing protein [Flavitalea sp.]
MNQIPPNMLTVDYSKKNLQKSSFKNKNLANVSFVDSDLRGADFSGADLSGADFTHVKTGITPVNTALLFLFALAISLVSGYVAMLAGTTVQGMLKSDDHKVKLAGYVSIVLIVVFIVYSYLKGGRSVIRNLLIPVIIISVLIGVAGYISGIGTGRGMFYIILSLVLVFIMFLIGTIARASAGVLSSSLLFLVVAIAGSVFGKSVGGGIGTVIMAIACALISKRALSGAKGFRGLRKIASFITNKFGTSFRNAKLTNANFAESKIHNADFTNADLSSVNWGDSKKINCSPGLEKY